MDVLSWLLEEDNPSVRYWTLRNLLDRPADDPSVVAAREQIMRSGPVPRIVAHLGEDGHYSDPGTVEKYGPNWAAYGYLPKYRGTVWQLILFADLAADGADPLVRRACEYVLAHSWREDGLFSMVGNQYLAPCYQGNMLYALSSLGYASDPRIAEAMQLLLTYTRFDDGDFVTPRSWPYRGRKDRCCGSHSCYAGCLNSLKAVAARPDLHDEPDVQDFVERGARYFLIHRVYHASHSSTRLLHRDIDEIGFPTFIYGDFVEILITLLKLGVREPRMQDAVDLLRNKQLPNGRWRLDRDVPTMHVRLGKKHHESKWATYRALYALKLWEE